MSKKSKKEPLVMIVFNSRMQTPISYSMKRRSFGSEKSKYMNYIFSRNHVFRKGIYN